ncbi:MAG TPA: hypothetical protein VK861_07515, partial [Bacteroidales bacterium]|nr:hypothetical protein [Bacteroidales bacterium]
MFYFLLFLGASLITWGMHKRKREVQIERAGSIKLFSTIDETSQLMPENRDSEMVSDLSDRMEELEKSLFNQLLNWQIEKEQLIEKLNTKTSDIMVENQAVLTDTAQIDETEFYEKEEALEPDALETAEIIAVEAPE